METKSACRTAASASRFEHSELTPRGHFLGRFGLFFFFRLSSTCQTVEGCRKVRGKEKKQKTTTFESAIVDQYCTFLCLAALSGDCLGGFKLERRPFLFSYFSSLKMGTPRDEPAAYSLFTHHPAWRNAARRLRLCDTQSTCSKKSAVHLPWKQVDVFPMIYMIPPPPSPITKVLRQDFER